MDLAKALVPLAPSRTLLPHGAANLAIFGASGSIGASTLDIVRRFPDRFRAKVLCVHRNIQALEKMVREFKPEAVGIADESACAEFSQLARQYSVQLACGPEECAYLAAHPAIDTVV
ncbi:MAG: hypothetical protein K1X79_11345, partial [Oligoflexia bacterium]|nr:hypothetical protein [Oligoflexia bacterium]